MSYFCIVINAYRNTHRAGLKGVRAHQLRAGPREKAGVHDRKQMKPALN